MWLNIFLDFPFFPDGDLHTKDQHTELVITPTEASAGWFGK